MGAQVKRQGRRWMLVLSSDDVPANLLAATGRQAGIDVGVVTYAHAITAAAQVFSRSFAGEHAGRHR